jgi:catechol 2,3-dioxygenase-like lactoylglutathione lyase family enzyme
VAADRRHWCFRAPDRAAVDAFHAAALAHGGRCDGPPGVRPHYHAHYYAAFVLDPDGNRIEAVCHRAPESDAAVSVLDHVQLAMPAGGEAEARRFYGGLLGLREIAKPPELAPRGGVWFALPPLELHLGVEAEFRPARKAHPAFRVADLDALLRRLAEACVAAERDTSLPGTRRAFAADPFGNRVELIQAPSRY